MVGRGGPAAHRLGLPMVLVPPGHLEMRKKHQHTIQRPPPPPAGAHLAPSSLSSSHPLGWPGPLLVAGGQGAACSHRLSPSSSAQLALAQTKPCRVSAGCALCGAIQLQTIPALPGSSPQCSVPEGCSRSLPCSPQSRDCLPLAPGPVEGSQTSAGCQGTPAPPPATVSCLVSSLLSSSSRQRLLLRASDPLVSEFHKAFLSSVPKIW